LLKDGETIEDLLKLTKEELLLRWFNYQLKRSAYPGQEITNFSDDIKDSIAYTYLLNQITPENYEPAVSLSPFRGTTSLQRAEMMLEEADKLKAREFVSANDVVTGNHKLNMA